MEEDAKARLKSVALKLFVERGYATTTVREIVEGAGVTKPVLYYHFKNKEGLYLDIMSNIATVFAERVNDLKTSQGTVTERMKYFLGGMLDGALENIDAVRLAYAIFFGPPQGAPFIDFNMFFDQTLENVESLLKEGIMHAELAACDTHLMSWLFVGTYHTIIEEQFCRVAPRVGKEALFTLIDIQLELLRGKKEDTSHD